MSSFRQVRWPKILGRMLFWGGRVAFAIAHSDVHPSSCVLQIATSMKCDPVWARLGETVCKYMHKPLIPYLFTGAGTHPSRRVATVSAGAGAESITHTPAHKP